MKTTTTFQFKIEHNDPMGQGVSKLAEDGKVDFILKTLPGETGTTTSYKEKGKLRFALFYDFESLTNRSPERIQSQCEHYNQCFGCHYLHSTYKFEVSSKIASLEFMSKRLNYSQGFKAIESIEASNRLGYRNRIQLHYDKKTKSLGFIRKDKNRIEKVEFCKLPNADISLKLQQLYQNNHWLKLVKNSKSKGHIELSKSIHDDEVQIHINEKYAVAGFSQVNEAMNDKLVDYITCQLNDSSNEGSTIVDLFGGNGNLTKNMTKHNVEIFDGTPTNLIKCEEHQNYNEINLYKDETIDCIKNIPDTQVLVVDPPRAGIKNLDEFANKFSPETIVYVSCHPQTMIRDIVKLQEVSSYKVKGLTMIDLFPSTYHFESICIMQKEG